MFHFVPWRIESAIREKVDPMAYRSVLADSTEAVNAADWGAVCDLGENPFMDLRFLRTLERALSDGKYWLALFYDGDRPVAAACYSLYAVDGAIFAPALQRAAGFVRRVWRSFFKFKLLLCGVPVGTGQGNISAVADANWNQLAPLLDEIAVRLARQTGAGFIAFKEFDAPGMVRLAGLEAHGYRITTSVVKYTLPREHPNFDAYYTSRSKRTRANMRKYLAKAESAGVTSKHLRGREGVPDVYTDGVHELYLNVVRRAQLKFELMPAEFFRELARQFPEESRFTFLTQGQRTVGFCVALSSSRSHDMLYCGVDYDVNAQADVYFNLVYQALGHGLEQPVTHINVGQSADEFKRRLGCVATQTYIYIKGVGAARAWIFGKVFGMLFDECRPEATAAHAIVNDEESPHTGESV